MLYIGERRSMEDYQIIALLFQRTQTALDEISRKYSRLYRRILGEILADESDIEECANDVLLAVWNSIPPNEPENLSAYICKLARRIGIDKLRYQTRQKRHTGYTVALSELQDCLPDTAAALHTDEENRHIRSVLSDFVRKLDPETRVLFIRRYIWLESTASLASRFALTENHIAVKLYRARKKLKKHMEKEGIQI